MPSLRDRARALTGTLRRHRRKSRILALGILVYVAIIAIIGGIDVMIGPVRFRSNETDWLLQLAVLAALVDLMLSETAAPRIIGFLESLSQDLQRVLPALGRTALIIAAAMAGLWLIGLLVTTMPEDTPGGDMALLELYTRQATDTQALIGPYSRFQWNHPGPSMFYLFRPLYQLSGERFAALKTSALLLNLACLVALLAVVRRRAGPMLLLPIAIGFIVYLWRVPDVLVSPWNPHLLLMPLALLFIVCAAALEGDARFAAAAVAVASFLIQTHLSVTPTAGALTAVALGALIVTGRRAPERSAHWRWLHVAVWVGLVMWFLPLAEEVSSPNGNMSSILESFFEDPQPGPVSRESAAAFFQMLSGFVLPGFGTAWGGLVLRSVSWLGFAIAAGALLMLPWSTGRLTRSSPFAAILATLLFGASIVALWSVLRIQGELFDQLIFWVSVMGVLNAAVAAATILAWLVDTRPAAASWIARAASSSAIALLVVAAFLGVRQLFNQPGTRPADPGATRIREGTAAVAGYLKNEGVRQPLVRIAPIAWGDAAGIVLALEKSGTPVNVEQNWVFMFGRPLGPTGLEDCEVVFADGVLRKALTEAGHHTILAQWPELTIFARKRPAPPAT